jgi:hemin uptake protein HemP
VGPTLRVDAFHRPSQDVVNTMDCETAVRAVTSENLLPSASQILITSRLEK